MACERCDDTGFVITDSAQGEFAVACGCRERQIRSRRIERQRRGDAIPRRFRDPSIGQRAIQALRPTARTRILAYRRDITERIGAGKGLWLYGQAGTARTVAAALVARDAHEAGHLVLFTSTVALLSSIKDDLVSDGELERPRSIDLIADPDLVVLHDLDAARDEDWAVPHLAAGLRRRAFRETRALVVTSDCHPSELGPLWGWGTVKALKDICGSAVNVDPDYVPPPPDPGAIQAARRARRAERSTR
jgi:hypothetical protein